MSCAQLGAKYIRMGLWLFIFGLVIGYGPLLHYVHGAMEDVQPGFLHNVTLWWGCPWTLATYFTQLGGLAMVVFGLCYLAAGKSADTPVSSSERAALTLCVAGIAAEFLLGYIGYFGINHVWPNFYFTPIPQGKNLWLGLQGISMLLYLVGAILVYRSIGRRIR